MVGDLHVVEFHLWLSELDVVTSLHVLGAGWACRCTVAERLSVFLLPLLRICCWVLVAVARQFLAAGCNNSDPLVDSLGWSKHSNLAESSLRSGGSVTPNSLVSVSPLQTFFRGHDTLPFFFFERKCLQEKMEKFMMFNKRRRSSHSLRVKLLLARMSASWVFGFPLSACQWVGFWWQHIWFGCWHPNWFCQTTNQAQLCEFLTRVSLLDWSQLRYLQKMNNWDSLSKNLRLRWRSPHATIDQHLGFPFCLGLDLWFICEFANSFLLRAWLVVWCCSMNVTLPSPHPTNQEQVIHSCAIQHPRKWFLIL